MIKYTFTIVLFAIVCLYSFKTDTDCVLSKDLQGLKNEIKKNDFYKVYKTKKHYLMREKNLEKKCIGLFYIGFKSKDNFDKVLIPLLRTENTSIYNAFIFEGKKLLKDSAGMRSKIEAALKEIETQFTKNQIDSIRNNFLYGAFSEPIARMGVK